jgi:hypothetical protein
MSDRVRLVIHGQPIPLERHRTGKGRTYLPARSKAYRALIENEWMLAGRPRVGSLVVGTARARANAVQSMIDGIRVDARDRGSTRPSACPWFENHVVDGASRSQHEPFCAGAGRGSWGLKYRRSRAPSTGLLSRPITLGCAAAVPARLSEPLEVGSLASRPGRGLAAIACGTQAPVRKSQGGKAQYGAYRPRRRELPDSGRRSAVRAAGWWRNATAAQQARGLELVARRHRPDL